MVLIQIAFAGVNVLFKMAAKVGMSSRVIVAYRFIFATAVVAPLALIFERYVSQYLLKKKKKKSIHVDDLQLTWVVLFQAFLCGLFACVSYC